MRRRKYVLALIICLLVLAGSWFLAANPTKPGRTQIAQPAQPGGSGVLDKMTFSGKVSVNGKPLDVIEKWVFAHGTFESTECALRCNYPRAPYFFRRLGVAIEFISESHCLDRDAKIVWRGMIDDGTVKGTMTWTISRWYWTIERKFYFEGTLTKHTASVSSN